MAKQKKRKTAAGKGNLKKGLYGLALLIFLVGLAAVAAYHLLPKQPPSQSTKPQKKTPTPEPRPQKAPKKAETPKPVATKPQVPQKPHKQPPPKIPTYEIYPDEVHPEPEPIVPGKPTPPEARPKVTIIIDDLGYDRAMADKFLALDAILTFSMFPESPHGKTIAEKAHKKGYEVMLHLPMEPNEYPQVNPGPGTLFTHMTPDELLAQLKKNIDSLPHILGVNNHMGSKLTANDAQMNQIFTILKKRNLFFIDSRTSTQTLARQSAHLLKVPFAERDIFIDHFTDAEFIRKQLRRLVQLAQKKGAAVGIGHPHQTTYEMLKEMLPEIKAAVKLVPASKVVGVVG